MDQSEFDIKWERVTVESGMIKADIVKGRLETEGIPVRFRYEAIGKIYGLTLDGLGEVELLVPSEHLEKAKKILECLFSEDEIPWNTKT
jgi:hypothetical protein